MIPGTTISIEDKSVPQPTNRIQHPITTEGNSSHILLFPLVVKVGPSNDPSKGKDDKSG